MIVTNRGRATYESMSRGDLIAELCMRDSEPEAKAAADAYKLALKVDSLEARVGELVTQCADGAALFERAPAPYCTHDRNGTIHQTNAAAAALFCASAQSLGGASLVELVAALEPETLDEHIRRTVDEGKRLTMEIGGTIRARGKVTLHLTSALLDDTRTAPWMCGTIIEDVTHARAEETRIRELLRLHDALAAAVDEDAALDTLAESCVPLLGDACVIELQTDDGPTLQRVRTKESKTDMLQERVEGELRELVWRQRTSRAIETLTPIFEAYPPSPLMVVPLVARGQALGVLALMSESSPYTLRQLETAMSVADRAAMALWNLRRALHS